MSTTDPNVEPGQVPDTGIVDPDVEPDQGDQDGAPTTDIGSAPALQPREGDGDMLT